MAERPDWPFHSLLAQLRPEAGWQLERACIASYSADVRVITAALLALGGHATEPEMGSRVQLVQAFRNLRGRVAFVVQRGRIHWPRNLPRVAALLDRFVFEADCDERWRSWHPKFAVMRWRHQESGEISWRVWLGSRNLTRDLSRDAGLLIAQSPEPASGQPVSGLRLAVKRLQTHLPHGASRFSGAEIDELERVCWVLPAGVTSMRVEWLDGGGKLPETPAQQQRVIIISPFVDVVGMQHVAGWMPSGKKPVVLSSEVELTRVCTQRPELAKTLDLLTCAAGVEEGTAYEQPAPHAADDAGDAERELDRSDEASAYHAKLIYMRRGREKRLWIGSPNLTDRGWCRNFELAAELISTASADRWGPVLEEIVKHASRFEPSEADVQALAQDKELEDLRKALCVELKCWQERRTQSVIVVAEHWPDAPPHGIELLVGLPWRDRQSVPWPWKKRELSLGELDHAECSDYLLFLLRKGEQEMGWLMQVPFRPPLDATRDSAAIAAYLGPHGYLDLIRTQLEPAKAAAPPWDAPGDHHGSRGAYVRSHLHLPSLEGLLRLYLRNPERLRAVAKTVTMLEKEAEKWDSDGALLPQARADLAAFRKLWNEVGVFLTAQADAART